MVEILRKWIKENYREYTLVGLLFIIGLFIGVMLVNNCNETQMQEISTYIGNFVTEFKNITDLNRGELIVKSIKNNIFLALIIWFAGTTVIGIPVVFLVILYRGLTLGFTVATISYTLGRIKGIIFCIVSLMTQNILFIPAILSIGVSSIKLYKSIIKDRGKENIKTEILRHTLLSGIMIGVLILSSLVENFISVSVLKNFIKYF